MPTVKSPTRRLAALAGLALLVASVAAGCARSNKTPQVIYITPKPGPTDTASVPPGGTIVPIETASAPTVTSILISTSAPDKKWDVTFKKPVVTGIPDSLAGPMNDAITSQVNSYISDFTGSDLPAVVQGQSPSTLEGNFSTTYASGALLSLRFSIVTYVSGGAHPTSQAGSINLAVGTGNTIALQDLFTDPTAAAAALAPKAHDSLANQLGDSLIWDGKASSLDFFATGWVFTADGLQFNWNQAEIATSAAGRPSVVISWSDLKPLLKSDGPAASFVH
jgi:hypothetical protein